MQEEWASGGSRIKEDVDGSRWMLFSIEWRLNKRTPLEHGGV